MRQRVFNVFKGMNTLLDKSLIGDHAVSCLNVDFRDGKLSAINDDSEVDSVTLSSDDKTSEYFNGDWRVFTSGDWGRWTFNHWKIGDADLLIHAQPGSSSKELRISEADPAGSSIKTVKLGLVQPAITTQPTGTGSGSGLAAGDYFYAITLQRTLYNHVSESEPVFSNSVTITAGQDIQTVMTNADAAISTDYYTAIGELQFNFYRLYNGEYRLATTAAVNSTTSSNTTVTDNTTNANLGLILPTQFQSEVSGDVVTYGEPPTDIPRVFGGISQEPYAGLIFAFREGKLNWCDTLKPDAWPEAFGTNFPFTILDVVTSSRGVYVITTKRIFYSSSTNPENMIFSELDGIPGATSWMATEYKNSVYFLAEEGVIQLSGDLGRNITAKILDRDFFRFHSQDVTSLDFRYSTIVAHDDKLYCSVLKQNADEGFNFIIDLRTMDVTNWQDETYWYQRFITNGESKGKLYAEKWTQASGNIVPIGDNGLVEIHGGDALAWNWKSGDVLLGQIKSSFFDEVEVRGSGVVALTNYLDDVSQKTKTLTFTNEDGRILGFREDIVARSAQIYLASSDGSGIVTESYVRGK